MSDLDKKRAIERSKYEAIYTGSRLPRYGSSNHWSKGWPWIKKMGIRSVADVGTGKGDFARAMGALGARAFGFDFAYQGREMMKHENGYLLAQAAAHDLPLADGEVEYVTAFDMLEHLLPDEVEEVLTEFKRVATKGFIFSISYVPSKIQVPVPGDRRGNLHPTVRSKEWWIETIERVTGASVEDKAPYMLCTLPDA